MMKRSWTKSSRNKRMRSKLNGPSDWTNFVHDEVDGMLLAEYTLISGTFTLKCLYTNGIGLISTNREGTKRYFHFDGLGSTWALSDENENLKDSYSYSAFGVTLSATSTNGPSTNPNRFVGRWGYYDDSAMGSAAVLQLREERYFSAVAGRYLSTAGTPSVNQYAGGTFGVGGDQDGQPPCEQPWRWVMVTCYGTGGVAGGNVIYCGNPRPPRAGDCAVSLNRDRRVCQTGQYVDIRRRGETQNVKTCRVCDVGGLDWGVDVFFQVRDQDCERLGPWHTGRYCVRCRNS